MRLQAVAQTHVGRRRQENEDHFVLVPEAGLFVVADGMGGHRAGQVASRFATEGATRAIEALGAGSTSLAERLRHGVSVANGEIFGAAQAKPELEGMGTTIVAALFDAGRLALAHIGDSRAYLLRGGRLRGLTNDHSVVAELLRRQEISEADAQRHPHRHVLTRALGVRPQTEPDLAEMTPLEGDLFVLCTDGLTSHVGDSEIARMLTDEADLELASRALVDAANDAGGLDNITVVLIRCEAED